MTEELYLVAYKDIEQKEIDESLWLKAMSHAGGDKLRAKWVYIELRVDQMLRDPSLRHSVSRKVSKPTHQSGAYMMWISVLFFLAVVVAAVSLDFESFKFDFTKGFKFLDLPSFLLVLPVSIFFGISATSWRSFGRCWTYSLGGAKQVTISGARSVARCLKVMGDVSLIMGIIGTFIGAILILQSMHTILNIGQPLSYVFIPLAYGVFFKLLTYVSEQRVRNLYLN
ncbi:MAG: hypothetical protein CL935_00655 [Deltaproteobacteria bacterium]|nr:hypothetical protein [Deltaproteobacteria bacterium]